MKFKIRKSTPDDVCGILLVQKTTWLKTYPNIENGITVEDIKEKFKIDDTLKGKRGIEERKKVYKNKNTGIWVAEKGKNILAYCIAVKENKFNRIGAIYVLPDYQRQGLGKSLIQKALYWLGSDKDILVNVAKYNSLATNFYKKLGFVDSKKQKVSDSASKLPSGKIIPEIELIKILKS